MPTTPIASPAHPRRTLSAIALGVVIAFGSTIAGLLAFATAALAVGRSNAGPLLPGLSAAAVAATGFATLIARRLSGRLRVAPRVVPVLAALATLLPTGAPLTLVAADRAPSTPPMAPDARGPHETWELPTGSQLAVWSTPGVGTRRATPVVHLHGGPGMYTPSTRFADGDVFRAAGFDTIYYDQAGGGASSRLSPADYTVERAVADLEAVRERLGTDRIVLWGTSWGTALAMAYADKHPDNVAGLVLTSPGPFPGTDPTRDYGVTNGPDELDLSPRFAALQLLLTIAPHAAERLMTQQQAGAAMDDLAKRDLVGRFACRGDDRSTEAFRDNLATGANPFANTLLQDDMTTHAVAPLTTRLSDVPSLVMRGTCDFLPRSNAETYATTLGTSVVDIEATGHGLIPTSSAREVLRRFLATELSSWQDTNHP